MTDARRTWRRHSETAFLVVGVAGDSLARDRGLKSRMYAVAGVAEYWIVDLAQACVHVLTDPDGAACRYRASRIVRRGETLRSVALPGVDLSVEVLFT